MAPPTLLRKRKAIYIGKLTDLYCKKFLLIQRLEHSRRNYPIFFLPKQPGEKKYDLAVAAKEKKTQWDFVIHEAK